MVFDIIAIACAGLFAGAAIYVSFVEHPARLACGAALAVRQFGPSYRRGAVMQASLAVIGLLAAAAAYAQLHHGALLVGGILLGAAVPYTLIAVRPTNARLVAPELAPDSAEAAALLRRWGALHAVRTGLGSLAFLVLLVCALQT
jgi:hypothetical protein